MLRVLVFSVCSAKIIVHPAIHGNLKLTCDVYQIDPLPYVVQKRLAGHVLIFNKILKYTLGLFQIDVDTFLLMTEEQVKELVPKLGDRAAIKNFCERHQRQASKQSLIQKLKVKLQERSKNTNKQTSTQERKRGSGAYRKNTRYVSLGWLCATKSGTYRHVRSAFGGGTRRKAVPRNSTCREILQMAKQIYFPNGLSKKGRLEDFNAELLDFSRARFNNLDMTVQEIYDVQKAPVILALQFSILMLFIQQPLLKQR